MYACIHTYTVAHTHIYIYTYTHSCIHAHGSLLSVNIKTYAYMHTYIHMYTIVYTCTDTFMYAYKPMLSLCEHNVCVAVGA